MLAPANDFAYLPLQQDWRICLREESDRRNRANAGENHHDPEDPSPAEETARDANGKVSKAKNTR